MILSARHAFGSRRAAGAIVLVLAALMLTHPLHASAHEERLVANDYTFVVGFIAEPAVQNDTNGISVEITKADNPVLGAADTLKAQVIFGDQTRDMTLTPAFGADGTYQAVFIPTQPGDYTFRFYGQLDGVAIDESFTSSPEGFDTVAARSDLEFPAVAQGNHDDAGPVTLGFPALAGGAMLILGGAGLFVRRRRSDRHMI